MNHEINRLIQFALDKEMITKDECDYSVNLLLDLFDENDFEYEQINEHDTYLRKDVGSCSNKRIN